MSSKNSAKEDRNDPWTRSPFTAREDSDPKFDAAHRSGSMRDLFTAHTKEKPNSVQIERQAAFQQLLNPNADTGAKLPSSLQPVVNPADLKPGVLGIPTVAGNSGLTPRDTDPMAAFNRHQDRLRGPFMDDINKKYSGQTTLPAKTSTLDPRNPLPLNRQPAMHDFPKRSF